MKQFLGISVAAFAMAGVAGGALAAEKMVKKIGKGEGQVDIVAWPGYIERGATDKAYDWVTDFEKASGCKVNVKTASTSDEMVALMNEGGFDLVTASGDASLRLISGKRVQPINTKLVKSWGAVDKRLQDAPWHTVNGVHYGVPYQWGPNVLMYNTEVFKDKPPTSWAVVFEEQNLPDGKPNKGRVQAYDGPIYIADAALYLMTKKPELGIKDPYELTEDQYKAALDLMRGQRKLVGRYWHDAYHPDGRLQERRRRRLVVMAVPGQHAAVREEADRLGHSGRRRHRLGRHDDDARQRRPSELRLHVARAFDQSEAAGRSRRLVRFGAVEHRRLQGQRPADRCAAATPTASPSSTRSSSGGPRRASARRRAMPASRTTAGSPIRWR